MISKPGIIPRLVIIEGKDKGKVITLTDGTAVIGRSKGDVLIQDPRISRSHVAIHFDSRTSKLTFTDLKSLNGTEVNGAPAESGELNDGDQLQIGNTLFDCQISIAGEESTSTSEILARSRARSAAKAAPAKAKPGVAEVLAEKPPADLLPLETPLPGAGKEPSLSADAAAVRTELKTESRRPALARLKVAYLKVPGKVRTMTLALLVLAILGKFFLPAGLPNGDAQNAALEKEIAAIKQIETSGLIDEAIARAEELAQKYSDRSEPFLLLGSLYALQNKTAEALAALKKAHNLPPEQPVAHIKMVRLYMRAGLPKEAGDELAHLEKVMNEKKFSRELFVEQAYMFLEFKDLKYSPEKVLILSKALQKEFAPDSSIGYKLEAQVHFQENRPQEALSAMEKGRVIDPQDEWLIENSMFAKLALKDFAGAEGLLDEWLKIRPAATKALLVLGYLRFNEKNYAKALPYVQRILQIANANPGDPYYPEALNLMGQIYQEMQQTAEAANFYRQGCTAGFQQSCDQPLLKADAGQPAPQTETAQAPEAVPDAAGSPTAVPSPASLPQNAPVTAPAPKAAPESLPENMPSALEQIAPLPQEVPPSPGGATNTP